MIILGEKIKEFRLRDGRTQDALATELGVTAQAVSRWEKGICFPDMEMIPAIANYFGISIDELFGYDNDRAKKVDAIAQKINNMIWENNGIDVNMDECISTAREALIEFPGNEKLTLTLAYALFNAGYVRHGEFHYVDEDGYSRYDAKKHKTYPEWQEAIKLYEKLLLSLPQGNLRQKAVLELSQLYKNTGAQDKALALADTASDLTACKPFLRIQAYDGINAILAQKDALIEMIKESAQLMVQIVISDTTLKPMDAAKTLENATELFALILPNHEFGNHFGLLSCIQMLQSYYLWLADQKDDAFLALNSACDLAKQFDVYKKNANNEKSDFASELPELSPWWDVPEKEKVKAEMQTDSRFKEWVRRTQGK